MFIGCKRFDGLMPLAGCVLDHGCLLLGYSFVGVPGGIVLGFVCVHDPRTYTKRILVGAVPGTVQYKDLNHVLAYGIELELEELREFAANASTPIQGGGGRGIRISRTHLAESYMLVMPTDRKNGLAFSVGFLVARDEISNKRYLYLGAIRKLVFIQSSQKIVSTMAEMKFLLNYGAKMPVGFLDYFVNLASASVTWRGRFRLWASVWRARLRRSRGWFFSADTSKRTIFMLGVLVGILWEITVVSLSILIARLCG